MPHIHFHIDYTVETFVVHKNKVLLRRHDKYGHWLSIGGHIELGEDPYEAAVRECREEVGLAIEIYGAEKCQTWDDDLKDLPTPISVYRHPISKTHEHVSFMYFGKANNHTIVSENEFDVWQWFTAAEIEQHQEIKPHIKKYALLALETLGTT